jgi:hypothetical protein
MRALFKSCGVLVVLAAALTSSALASAGVFTVTSPSDSGLGSLRDALEQANATPGPDTIDFAILGAGVATIAVTSGPLPAVTDAVVIDGRSEPGFTHSPLIQVDNQTGDSSAVGLDLNAGPSQVLGLDVTGFGVGVKVDGAADNVVAGSWLGFDRHGQRPNNYGILISGAGATRNLIGGVTPADRNVISGNTVGVAITSGATANVVSGNYVGTTKAGDAAVGNTGAGILLESSGNTVGGGGGQARNVISGNGDGVVVSGADGSNNVVEANYVGTDATGEKAVPNAGSGVVVEAGASSNTIGGLHRGQRDLISGNDGDGVLVSDVGTSSNAIVSDYIGTNPSGEAELGNGGDGVAILDGPDATSVGVDGFYATQRNVVSGNAGAGIRVRAATNVTVTGETIGADEAGAAAIPNGEAGIDLDGATGFRMGGSSAFAFTSLIANNHGPGVAVHGGSTSVFIGLNTIRANDGCGVEITDGTTKTTVENDTLAENGACGVLVSGASTRLNTLIGNNIGIDRYPYDPMGNHGPGIEIADGTNENQVGGRAKHDGNRIGFNSGDGVLLDASGAGNLLAGNFIGTTYGAGIVAGNAGDGIAAKDGAGPATIGDIQKGYLENVIVNNAGAGISVTGGATTGQDIERNSISNNAGLGIALLDGGNNDQAPPVITSVVTTLRTTVRGTLTGVAPSTQYRIQLFANPSCDPSGAGEGDQYLTAKEFTSDPGGNLTFVLKAGPLAPGLALTTTATNGATGDTSEFSRCSSS